MFKIDFIIRVFKTKAPNTNIKHNLVMIIILKTLNHSRIRLRIDSIPSARQGLQSKTETWPKKIQQKEKSVTKISKDVKSSSNQYNALCNESLSNIVLLPENNFEHSTSMRLVTQYMGF